MSVDRDHREFFSLEFINDNRLNFSYFSIISIRQLTMCRLDKANGSTELKKRPVFMLLVLK